MKLVYQIEDKLFWIHDFLPFGFYQELHKSVFKSHKIINQDTKKHWDSKLLINIKSPKKINLKETFNKQYATFLKHQPFINFNKCNDITFTIHKMSFNSGISWHNDFNHKYAATFYINKRWNFNWGGEFMYKTDKQLGFIPVIGNSLLLIKTPLIHKVNPVTSNIVPRLSIQSFIE